MYVMMTLIDNEVDMNVWGYDSVRNSNGKRRKFRTIAAARKYGEIEAKRSMKLADVGLVQMEIVDAWEIDNNYFLGAIETKEITA